MKHADSGDINIPVQFRGSSILEILLIYWKCVGDSFL